MMSVPSRFSHSRSTLMRSARNPLIGAGQWVVFISQTLWYLPLTVRKYSRQTLQAMNSLAWGRGSIIVDGGTISVLIILGVAVGASAAIEGFAILNLLGFGALSGIIGGVGTVREIGPLVGGIAYTAQAGCRMTAEIGAMRISDEIDAVDAMGLRPIPFVVGTRLIGGLIVVIPGYMLTLVGAFAVQNTFIKLFYGQPGGTYDHYLDMFVTPRDLAYSVLKVSVFCIAVTLIHCYYGYFTSGGPVGVGQASGRAVRASLVTIMALDFVMTVALWGFQPQFIFRG
jgi:phospholipid/cholesterol/gamma-HCH transport system permease protein